MSLILASAVALFVAPAPAPADPVAARTPAPAAAPAVVDPADGYQAFRRNRSLCLRATRPQAANRLNVPLRRTICRTEAYWTASGLGVHQR